MLTEKAYTSQVFQANKLYYIYTIFRLGYNRLEMKSFIEDQVNDDDDVERWS